MLRGVIISNILCVVPSTCLAQWDVPLVEPTNRSQPVKFETANVFSFCQQDESIAYVPANNHASVHQFVPTGASSPKPIEFSGDVELLSGSPDGKRLAALVENEVHFASRASRESKPVVVPISSELEAPSEFKWSADSKVLFAIRSDSPASVTRIVLDQSEPEQDISIGNRIYTCFPNSTGELFVAFTSEEVEIWRNGENENKVVNGHSRISSGSPDGRFVAFNADDKLQIWTLDPLGKGATVEADDAKWIHFSADGRQLLISEVDDKARCYAVSDDGQLSLNQEYKSSGTCWLSDDGTLGACSSSSKTSRLMRVFNCEAKAEIEVPVMAKSGGNGGFDPDIYAQQIQISNDGLLGLVEFPAGRLELFDVRSQLSVWGCRVPELARVWLVANGDRMMTVNRFGILQIHDTKNGRMRRHAVSVVSSPQVREQLRDTKSRFQLLPDGKHCVVWCGATLRDFVVIELATQKVVGRVPDSESTKGNIRAWRTSDDGSIVCVVKDEIELLRTGFQSQELRHANNFGRFHMTVKPFRAKELTHGIYDTKSGQKLRTLRWKYVVDDSFLNWAHISPDGELCALVARRSDGDGMGVEVRSTQTGEQVFAISLGDSRVKRADFTRDQKGMWIVTQYEFMRLDFNNKTLTPFLTDSETHTEPVEHDPKRPTPLPDSKWQTTRFASFAESDTGWIATGHARGFVNIWSLKDQKRYAFLRCGTERVEALAFSPDGRYLMSWCADRNQLQITDISSILPAAPPEPIGNQDVDLDF